MAITQKLREIGGIINSTDLNYNFNKMQEDLQLAVEGVIFNDAYSQLDTIADRNNIPSSDLITGLWVAVAETGIVYEYNSERDSYTTTHRNFGIGYNDLPDIPYRIEGDPTSGVMLNAIYVCQANDSNSNWQYTSATTGLVYHDQDWAVYIQNSTQTEAFWIRVPKWIEIMNVTSILESGLVGHLSDLHTEDKTCIVNAINEVHDDLGTLNDLTTTAKNTAIAAINEVDGDVGDLTNLTTTAKNNLVAATNEIDANVGPIENLTTVNKGNTVLAINELDGENGNLTDLHTEAKDTFVNAINEVHDDLGTLTNLTTTNKNTAVDAINELDNRVGQLGSLTTTNKTNIVASINEVDGDVGTVSDLTTTTKTNTVAAINELKTITDSLRGAMIIIGRILVDTTDITEAALTARALEIMGGTVVQSGWTLVDNEQHEWTYNGTNWQDLEQPNIYPAQNGTLGTVRGAADGDASITDGNITIRHSTNSDQLNGQPHNYYATATEVALKAYKTDVLELDNTTVYTPTGDYNPATKYYVDSLVGEASWGQIINNIEDQTDLMDLLDTYILKTEGLTKTNTVAYTPTESYHPATKLYVDTKYAERNEWGQITGDIADQQDLQNELLAKQNAATAWNTTNLVISATQPEVPASGYIVWIDLNS